MSYVFWRRKKWYNFDTVHFAVGQLSLGMWEYWRVLLI